MIVNRLSVVSNVLFGKYSKRFIIEFLLLDIVTLEKAY